MKIRKQEEIIYDPCCSTAELKTLIQTISLLSNLIKLDMMIKNQVEYSCVASG